MASVYRNYDFALVERSIYKFVLWHVGNVWQVLTPAFTLSPSITMTKIIVTLYKSALKTFKQDYFWNYKCYTELKWDIRASTEEVLPSDSYTSVTFIVDNLSKMPSDLPKTLCEFCNREKPWSSLTLAVIDVKMILHNAIMERCIENE